MVVVVVVEEVLSEAGGRERPMAGLVLAEESHGGRIYITDGGKGKGGRAWQRKGKEGKVREKREGCGRLLSFEVAFTICGNLAVRLATERRRARWGHSCLIVMLPAAAIAVSHLRAQALC